MPKTNVYILSLQVKNVLFFVSFILITEFENPGGCDV